MIPPSNQRSKPIELVFSCDTYQMNNRVTYFRSLASSLQPGGRAAILDFHPRGFVSGLFGHRVQKEEVRREMEDAGYLLVDNYDFIDRQHFQFLRSLITENP